MKTNDVRRIAYAMPLPNPAFDPSRPEFPPDAPRGKKKKGKNSEQ